MSLKNKIAYSILGMLFGGACILYVVLWFTMWQVALFMTIPIVVLWAMIDGIH